jgi:DNA-binding response OmpR family regulator
VTVESENAAAAAPARILVVEDEAHLAAGLKLNFELEGYAVSVATTSREAMASMVDASFDVIVLDVQLPDMDGYELCRRLRRAGNRTPVIMLTARVAAEDRITGLDAGADDYLPKPFELQELLARLRSALRRRRWDRGGPGGTSDAPVLSFGRAEINFDTHEVTVDGDAVRLTQLELDLLRYFARNAGRVIGRDELLENVWKLGNYPNTRTVDNFIARLRKHFEVTPTKPEHFLSVRGSGYRFMLEPKKA